MTARVKNGEDPNALLEPVMEQIRQMVGEFLYGVDVGDLQTAAVRLLTEKGLKVAVAESCTGGYLAKRVAVKGLTGGHSGDDINKNRANVFQPHQASAAGCQ